MHEIEPGVVYRDANVTVKAFVAVDVSGEGLLVPHRLHVACGLHLAGVVAAGQLGQKVPVGSTEFPQRTLWDSLNCPVAAACACAENENPIILANPKIASRP